MEEYKSKVYIKIDERSRILRCEGGYTMSNIRNIEEWIFLDEGTGDKYNLCQSCYFKEGLFTEDGIPRYKYENGEAVLTTDAEIEADRNAIPTPPPTTEERLIEVEEQLLATDEVAVELYENQLAQEEINIAQDEAIVSLYEMMEV